jgi:hypothetical protein
MSGLTIISQKLVEKKNAMKLARSFYDFASRSGADQETKEFLWNKYLTLSNMVIQIERIVKEIGFATIELQKAVEWCTVSVYKPQFLDTLRLIYPDCSDPVFTLFHQEEIDKAVKHKDLAIDNLTNIFLKAESYFSS